MSNVIKELRKYAWIETIMPELGNMAPIAERAVRRGAINVAQSMLTDDDTTGLKRRKDGSR